MKVDEEERRGREEWNFENGFDGQRATSEERKAEAGRRQEFEDRRHRNGSDQQIPKIPSIATSTRDPGSGKVMACADATGSIPTATVDLSFEGSDNGSSAGAP